MSTFRILLTRLDASAPRFETPRSRWIDFARAECEPVSEGFFERGAERENDDLPASELRCYGGSYSYVAGFTTSIVATNHA